MELPPYLHPRYVPYPLPPAPPGPPPPTATFSDDGNVYPLYLPPPPPSPPPPHHHHRQPHFTFGKHKPNHHIDDETRPRNPFNFRVPPDRISSWEQPRVSHDDRNRIPIPIQIPIHYHRPVSPSRSRIRYESERGNSFCDEFYDDEVVWIKRRNDNDNERHRESNREGNHDVLIDNKYSRDFRHNDIERHREGNHDVLIDNKYSRDFRHGDVHDFEHGSKHLLNHESNSEYFESRHGLLSKNEVFWDDRGDGYCENRILDHSRDSTRGVDRSPIKRWEDKSDHGAMLSTRDLELERFGNRGMRERERDRERENNRGFVPGIKKKLKMQKKSVLQRIKMGKRNSLKWDWNDGYLMSKLSSIKDKDQIGCSEEILEEEREGSPVEMDVSFQSNGLVGKAIIGLSSPHPSSCSNPDGSSDRSLTPMNKDTSNRILSLTPRNRNIRKGTESPVDLETSGNIDNSSGSDKGLKPFEKKCTVLESSNGVENSAGKSMVDEGKNVGFDGITTHNVRKKKLVVKRPISRLSSSQPMKIKDKLMGTVSGSSSGINSSVVEGSIKSLVTEKDGKCVGSDGNILVRGKKKKQIVRQIITKLPSSQATEIQDKPVNLNTSKDITHSDVGLRTCAIEVSGLCENKKPDESKASDTKKGGTKTLIRKVQVRKTKKKRSSVASKSSLLLDKAASVDTNKDEVCEKSHHMDLSFENGIVEGPEKDLVLARDNINVDSSCPEETDLVDPINASIVSDDTVKQARPNQVSASNEKDIVDFLESIVSLRRKVHGFSSSDEKKVDEDNSAIVLTDFQKKASDVNNCNVDDMDKKDCLDGVSTEGSPEVMVSEGNLRGDSGRKSTPNTRRKRKVKTKLNFLGSDVAELCVKPINVVNTAHDIDTTLSFAVPAAQSGDIGLHNCPEKVTMPSKHDMMENVKDDPIRVSTKSTNERKVLASSVGSTGLSPASVTIEGPVVEDTPICDEEVPMNFSKDLIQQEEEVAVPMNFSKELMQQEEEVVVLSVGSRSENLEDGSLPTYLPLCADEDGEPTNSIDYHVGPTLASSETFPNITASNSIDDLVDPTLASSETFPIINASRVLDPEMTLTQVSLENSGLDDSKLDEQPDVNDSSLKKAALQAQGSTKVEETLKTVGVESSGKKNQLNYAGPKAYTGSSSFLYSSSKKMASSTHMPKTRTWVRTAAQNLPTTSKTVPPQRQSPKKTGKAQNTSYIRKGNSLVRKPASASVSASASASVFASASASASIRPHRLSQSVYRLHPSVTDETKKIVGSESTVGVVDSAKISKTGVNLFLERPITPPLSNCTKSLNSSTIPQRDSLQNGCFEIASDPKNPSKSSEDAAMSSSDNNVEIENVTADEHLGSSSMKKIVYVKRKSNQLVAATNTGETEEKQALTSDGYYKRRKNQLIRNIDTHVSIPDDGSNSEGQRAPKHISSKRSRGFSKRRFDKVLAKTQKPSKLSLVWTLRGAHTPKKGHPVQRQKVLPTLIPWKRMSYARTFTRNSSSSMISRKLLFSRKRDTVYTRSPRGFSLRKSKVLSVGGPNLKWSKSIEKHSRKANEEATRAVAAAEKQKREQSDVAPVISGPKVKSHSSRERIYRIGSLRYKMDSSKRTLQRISDEEPSTSAALQPQSEAKKPYVPRRLLIGNTEYVRIGNGNQLVRDPKKRIRTLASEKVKWSLHTARQRLAKKRKYCQFYTRFGKCNKEDGKCPYLHDPSKIAVCTKFLNGLCSNPNCELTHKVIPERMPDCSYFLQGLCSNESCPYRHVNVNPSASICEAFLKGYCADGDECRKKHSYVCSVFEATGTCPQGSKCKLHHPKDTSSKSKKRKRLGAQGRYFGSTPDIPATAATTTTTRVVPERQQWALDDGGDMADFISLGVSDDDEADVCDDRRGKKARLYESEPLDLEMDDVDECIKPFFVFD